MVYVPVKRNSVFDDLIDDVFGMPGFTSGTGALMKTDIRETEAGYDLDVELPGYKKEDLNLELNGGYLNISAEKNTSNEEKDDKGRVIRRERFSGSMKRSFYVGDEVTEEDIKARFEDGILKLFVPKKVVEEQIPEKKTIAIEG